MKKNVGLFEAFMRTMMGFAMFGKGLNWRSNMLVIFASALIASGITRYCPCYHMMGRSTCDAPWDYAKSMVGKMTH